MDSDTEPADCASPIVHPNGWWCGVCRQLHTPYGSPVESDSSDEIVSIIKSESQSESKSESESEVESEFSNQDPSDWAMDVPDDDVMQAWLVVEDVEDVWKPTGVMCMYMSAYPLNVWLDSSEIVAVNRNSGVYFGTFYSRLDAEMFVRHYDALGAMQWDVIPVKVSGMSHSTPACTDFHLLKAKSHCDLCKNKVHTLHSQYMFIDTDEILIINGRC